MSNLLGDSIHTPPKDNPAPFHLKMAGGDREGTREAAQQGDIDGLRSVATNRTWNMSQRYCRIGDSLDANEPILHSLWYMYYQGSRVISHDTAEHDRFVLDVVRTRGLGPLTRPTPWGKGVDIARTLVGVVWNDLPYFVSDMTEYWINDCPTMEASHRLNFASFLAKLASTRICNDKLGQIALLLFRETFETDRPFGNATENAAADPRRSMLDLTIADLLPAACAWIREAGIHLILLSDASWIDCAADIRQGGRAYLESALGQRAQVGFGPWRLMYWLKRLHEICNEAEKAGENGLMELAADSIEFMVNNIEERNSNVIRVFGAASDEVRHDEHLVGLKNLAEEDRGT